MLQKNGRDFEAGIHHRNVQSAGAVGRNIVGVGSVGEQNLNGFFLAVTNREQQGREARFRFRFHIRAEFDQRFDGGSVALSRGPHQGRLPFHRLLHIHFRAVGQQHFDGVYFAGQRSRHQSSLTFFGCAVGIGPGLEQMFNHRGVSIGAGERQRIHVVASSGLHIRAVCD